MSEERIKLYGKIYGVVAARVKKSLTGEPLTAVLQNLCTMLNEAGKSMPECYPRAFYQNLADASVRWVAYNNMELVGQDGVIAAFNAVWEVHKKYLSMEQVSDQDLEVAISDADSAYRKLKETKGLEYMGTRWLFAAALMDLQ